ncbi:RNA polymerase subunit sigma [Achromobacter sp. HZ28]|nr:RNA polymerase subunit sigma [Achromobacter sp. HZ28]OWT78651.1 RNA polymerase subunit sigma [Achromobacter sp. HZ34]
MLPVSVPREPRFAQDGRRNISSVARSSDKRQASFSPAAVTSEPVIQSLEPSTPSTAPSRTQHDWAALVRSVAQERDRASFITIYDHYAPRLQRYLEGLSVPSGLAEELVQDALLKLWHKANLFDPARASLSTWLYRVTRNLYIDHHRNDKGWIEVQAVLEDFEADDTSSTEEEATEQALLAALAQLPEQQARVVHMSYFQAKTQREIAADLRMPLGTVKSHIRRAFDKLRKRLRD